MKRFSSIRFKLLLLAFVLLSVPLTCFSIYTVHTLSRVYQDQLIQVQQARIVRAGALINSAFYRVISSEFGEMASKRKMLRHAALSLVDVGHNSERGQDAAVDLIHIMLKSIFEQGVTAFIYDRQNDQVISYDPTCRRSLSFQNIYGRSFEDILKRDDILLLSQGFFYYLKGPDDDYLAYILGQDQERVVAAFTPAGHSSTYTESGYRTVLENLQLMLDNYFAAVTHIEGHMLVVDGAGKVLYGQDPHRLVADNFEHHIKSRAENGEAAITEFSLSDDGHEHELSVYHYEPLDWYLIYISDLRVLFAPLSDFSTRVLIIGGLLGLVFMIIGGLQVARLLQPLEVVSAQAVRLGRSHLTDSDELRSIAQTLTQQRSGGEIGRIADAIAQMVTSLGENLQKLLQTQDRNKKVEGELGAAREIQMGMLPGKIPQKASAPYATDGLLIPAKEVGGDLYDICPLPGGRLGLVIGDVSDKGVPAALFMTMTVTLIREGLALNMNPGRLMNEVNLRLAEHNPNMMFVTLFIGVLERRSGRLTYANGGHCQPLVFSSSGEVRALTGQSGPVVGALPECSYEEFSATLKAGEGMLLYTDGVSEAQNEAHELFGEERIKELLRERHDSSSTQLLAAVEDAVERFRGAAAQSDDITMVALTPYKHA